MLLVSIINSKRGEFFWKRSRFCIRNLCTFRALENAGKVKEIRKIFWWYKLQILLFIFQWKLKLLTRLTNDLEISYLMKMRPVESDLSHAHIQTELHDEPNSHISLIIETALKVILIYWKWNLLINLSLPKTYKTAQDLFTYSYKPKFSPPVF
jgi:hypothetical protein